MFKTTTKLIIAVLLLLSTSLFAQEIKKDKQGNALTPEGQTFLMSYHIAKDEKGIEKALDWYGNKTDLTLAEFLKHSTEYWERIQQIITEKGLDIYQVSGSIDKWYENKVNLDKLEELKAAGFDALPTDTLVKGIGGKFEATGITAETIIIGEVIASEKPDQRTTGYRDIYSIKVDEIIKDSKNITVGKEIRCGLYFEKMAKNPPRIGQKRVFVINKAVDTSLIPFCPLILHRAWELDNGIIKGKPNSYDDKTISLEEYKKRVKELVRINDADNFYKRSWKEKQ